MAARVVEVGRRFRERFRPGDLVAPWTEAGGALAEYFVAEARYCTPVPADLPCPEVAEPLGCILNAVTASGQQVGDTVVVVGATGFMGLQLVAISSLAGAGRIIATGRTHEGLERAVRFGATHTVNTTRDDLEQVVHELTGGRGADVSYESVGREWGLRMAGRTAHAGNVNSKGGHVVVVGYHQGDPRPTEWGDWNGKGLDTVNAHFRPWWECVEGMRRAVGIMASGQFDPSPLVTHTFPFDRTPQAFEMAGDRPRDFLHAVITFD